MSDHNVPSHPAHGSVSGFSKPRILPTGAAPGTHWPSIPWYVQSEEVSGWQNPPQEPRDLAPQDPSPGQGAEGDSVGGWASKALKEPLLCFLIQLDTDAI